MFLLFHACCCVAKIVIFQMLKRKLFEEYRRKSCLIEKEIEIETILKQNMNTILLFPKNFFPL